MPFRSSNSQLAERNNVIIKYDGDCTNNIRIKMKGLVMGVKTATFSKQKKIRYRLI